MKTRWMWMWAVVMNLSAQEPVLQTELVMLSLHRPVNGLYYFQEGKPVEVRAGLVGLSPPSAYKGPALLPLFAESILPATPEEPLRPMALVQLPLNVDRVLLLFTHKDGEAPRATALPAGMDGLKAGEYRLFNFSSHTLAIGLGDRILRIEAGGIAEIRDAAWDNQVLDLTLQMVTLEGGEPRLIFSSVHGHDPRRRNFMFLFDGPHPSAPVVLRTLHDRVAAPAKADNP